MLGYGYMAFWQPSSGRLNSVFLENRWAVTGAHNGFLEVWLSFGAIGLALVLFTFARAILDAASCVLRGRFTLLKLVRIAYFFGACAQHRRIAPDGIERPAFNVVRYCLCGASGRGGPYAKSVGACLACGNSLSVFVLVPWPATRAGCCSGRVFPFFAKRPIS